MAISIAVLAVAAALLLRFALRSRYGLPLFLMTGGMGTAAVAVLFQTYSTSSYSPPRFFPLRALDISLYRFIGGNRPSAARVQTLRSLGILLYLAGVLFLLLVIIRNLKHQRTRRVCGVCFAACFAALGALYLAFYSPACAYRLYLRYYALTGAAQARFRLWIERLDLCLRLLILLYAVSPALLLGAAYARRGITYFADTFYLLSGVALLFAGMFYALFFTGHFAQRSASVFRSGFWFFSPAARIPAWITLVFLTFSLLLLVFILMNANRIFGGELVLFSRKKAMKNSIEDLNRNLKDVFHSEKNLMFSMMILADGVKAEYGTPEGLEKLERLRAIAQSRMEIITSSLNRIRELQLSAAPVDMRRMMDQALADITLPEGIRCEKRYCDFPARCVIDEYHTRSAVKNLFANAVDALQLSDRPDKKITVSVDASREWVSLSVRDNGTGIDRRELRRVMLPFVSTKSKTSNWGIGLPYAFRVVSAQLGQMRIRSSVKPGAQYTQVDILLPRERRSDP